METPEIYDYLEGKASLHIYMAKDAGGSVPLSGGMLTQGRYTRVLQDSYDWRPVDQRKIQIGERLTCSAVVSEGVRRIMPTDWVVVDHESYEPSQDALGFREVVIVYCDRQPLTLEEFREWIYDTGVQLPQGHQLAAPIQ